MGGFSLTNPGRRGKKPPQWGTEKRQKNNPESPREETYWSLLVYRSGLLFLFACRAAVS